MGFLSAYDGTEDLDLSDLTHDEPGTWTVTIKKALTNKQLYQAKQHLARIIKGKASPNVAAYQAEMVIAAVVDWNLTDANNHDLPLYPNERKEASITGLPEVVYQRILARVQELNREPTDEEANSFRADGDGGDERGPDELRAVESLLDEVPDLGEDGPYS